MAEARIAQKAPYAMQVEAGTEYWWCACGLSRTQPLCDGSHAGSGMAPVQFVAPESATVYFCGCKRAGSAPLCDGTHRNL